MGSFLSSSRCYHQFVFRAVDPRSGHISPYVSDSSLHTLVPTTTVPLIGEPSEVPAINHWFQKNEKVWDAAHHHIERAIHRHNPSRHTAQRISTVPAGSEGVVLFEGHLDETAMKKAKSQICWLFSHNLHLNPLLTC